MEAAGNMHGYLMKTFTSKEHTEGTSVLNPGVLVEGLHAFLFFLFLLTKGKFCVHIVIRLTMMMMTLISVSRLVQLRISWHGQFFIALQCICKT